jgi:predicted dehydrogenase
MQLGIHALDLVHYLLAPVSDVQAYARSVTTQPGVVDSVAASFRTDAGATGTMVSNYCTPVLFEYRISGTEGSVRCTPHALSFQSSDRVDGMGYGPPEEHDFSAFGRESYDLQMADFGDAVRRGTPPLSDGWSGLQALAVVEAMAESVERGGPVSVPRTHQPVESHAA